MPEGPECHKLAMILDERRGEQFLTDVRIIGGRYKTHGPFAGYSELVRGCATGNGLRLEGVAARGKLIVFMFEGGVHLHCTLGLKGGWSRHKRKHSGVCLVFSNGLEWFDDQLHYGTLRVCTEEQTLAKIMSLGPDVCRPSGDLTLAYLQGIIRKRPNWDIAKLLMDQSLLAGLGNYLKSDVLYACGIHPSSRCGAIPVGKQAELLAFITELPVGHLNRYKQGGRLRKLVYGKKRDSSGNCVSKVKTGDKRNTHFVPAVQEMYC